MKAIGGYFGMELRHGKHYYKDAIKLNTARNCLKYILRAKHITKIYIPYFTCNVILEPIQKGGIEYEFYSINEKLEPIKKYVLQESEVFLYTNYFGLKSNAVTKLSSIYGKQLIVDNAQAFFAKPIERTDTFYSPRKFFGVSDGAYLYSEKKLNEEFEQDFSFERMSHLLKRIDLGAELGYEDFIKNDNELKENPIKSMSNITEKILQSLDYSYIKKCRIDNFHYLHGILGEQNKFHFDINKDDVPMIYPFFIENGDEIKEILIKNKIFIATYWPNIFKWCSKKTLEYTISKNLITLPIDQRYNLTHMKYVISIIRKHLS